MRVNSINSQQYLNISKTQKFGNSAVPYPEYKNAYVFDNRTIGEKLSDAISALLHPQVANEAENIKSQIDSLYIAQNQVSNETSKTQQTPKESLLSVFA